jgi:hypothetical protein
MLRHALERATRRANCLAAFCAAALIMLAGMMAYLIAAVR